MTYDSPVSTVVSDMIEETIPLITLTRMRTPIGSARRLFASGTFDGSLV